MSVNVSMRNNWIPNTKYGKTSEKDNIVKQAKQATSSLIANNYGSELAREVEKLKGQRGSYSVYSTANKAEDYARAYRNLYDEIVQGYQNGTRERYVEDKASETGYRKMTMEEEINGLDKAFQRAADQIDTEEMISGELKRLLSKAGRKGTAGSNKTESTTDYMNKLKKLAPSVEFRIGSTYATDKSGKTLTINPKLLEKMQNDPEMEKKMKELIAGVEKMTKIADAFEKARGMTCVFRHSYIDENGNYCQYSYVIREDKLNEKLREERRQNSEKLIKKTREKAAEKKEELQEQLEEKKTERLEQTKKEENEEKTEENALSKAENYLDEKLENSDDGTIYVDDTDFKTFMEAVKEDASEKEDKKTPTEVGSNLDLKV